MMGRGANPPSGSPPPSRAEGAEDDHGTRPVADNSLGRLFALSDGVFAIAMTLLALDLRVPDLNHPSDAALRHALAQNSANYWAYIAAFFAVANYWSRHRRLLRSVVTDHPRLYRDTMFLLILVAALPFPAGLLGRYGGRVPFALALYGIVNALAVVMLLQLRHDVRRLGLAGRAADPAGDRVAGRQLSLSLAVYLLCIPAGYVLHGQGPWVLLLLGLILLRRVSKQWGHRAGSWRAASWRRVTARRPGGADRPTDEAGSG